MAHLKFYQAERPLGKPCQIFVNGKRLSLRRSLSVINHSPTGFEWGYAGSGPAQTALAILLDFTNGKRNFCERFHQRFKFQVISKVPKEGTIIPGVVIQEFITLTKLTEEALGRPLCELCLCETFLHSEKGRCWSRKCKCGMKHRKQVRPR